MNDSRLPARRNRALRQGMAQAGSISGKLLVGVLILACLAVGVAGLILPLVPGVLFLAVAAILLTKHFPSTRGLVRRSPTLNRHFERADSVSALSVMNKLRLGALVCARGVLAGAGALTNGLRRGFARIGERGAGRGRHYG